MSKVEKQVKRAERNDWRDGVLERLAGKVSAEDMEFLRRNLPTDAEIAAMEE